ncbi:MAG: hypothetical protein V5789_05760 [Colwellia sp.]
MSVNTQSETEALTTLPTLCPHLIEDMGQLFSIYTLSKAMSIAKHNWPQYRFIQCSEYDMDEKEPFKVFNGFSFFLIAASFGCATLTFEPHKSVGLIIAEHEVD